MPNNNPRTPKRSWRGDHTGSSRAAKGQPTWKAEKNAVGASPRLSRNMRIALVLALFLVVIGVIVVVWLIPHSPDPFRLVLIGPGYEQNLAVEPNVLGVHTLDDMEQWSKDYNDQPFHEKGKVIDVRRPALTCSSDPVAEALAKCTSQTVVVFLSGEGGGDAQGAFLLPEDAGPHDLTCVYSIGKVLASLQNLPPETKKLLLLDGSQHGPNWTMGRLHNEFVRSVKSEPLLGKVKNLVVLCSCDEGEQSWTSEEYGQTIFGHFVIEGLKGAADQVGAADDPEHCAFGDGNTRITVEELAKYVQCEVDRWARRNRGFDQKPLLLDADNIASVMELVGSNTSGYTPPSPTALSPWTPPPSLADAWKEHEDLAASSPPPAAYTPQQWRVYQAALLRYEQLLRQGGAQASALRQTLTRLHDQIAAAQRLDRDSASNSLAAPAAFGWSLTPDPAVQLKDGFDQLWRDKAAKPDQYQRLLSGLQDQAPNRATRQLLRVRLIGLLLDKAPLSHDDYLRVCAVLPKLAEKPTPQPAEANFAMMAQVMEAQLPSKAVASWDVMKQALTVRRSAETAAMGLGAGPADLPAYSEQTAPWIDAAVDHADVGRRVGEDLMFASMRDQAQAAKALKDAEIDGESNYKTVRDRALILRQAIQARDRALADLPWYTQWLGRRPLSKLDEDSLAALWASAHDLCDQLEKPDYARAATLGAATDAVNAGWQKRHDDFIAACEKKRDAKIQQHDLNELEDLLSVPFIESGLRMSMLKDARRISLALNVGTANAAAASEDPLNTPDHPKVMAFQQGRLAVAVLGKDVDEGKKAGRLLQLFEQQPWQPQVDEAGDLIAHGFQNLARDARDDAEKGRRAPLADAAPLLRGAALKTRFLDAGETDAWLKSVDPVDENRRLQLHDLLVWQAERTRLDYWASDDPTKPYYRAAGAYYIGDARDLAAGEPDLKDEEKTARLGAVEQWKTKLPALDAVGFQRNDGDAWKTDEDKAPVKVTDEKTIELQYYLAGPKNAPPGRPVVWAKAGPKLIAAPEAGEPSPLTRLSDKPADSLKAYTLTPDHGTEAAGSLGKPDDTDFAVTGLYRGRTLSMDTAVRLYNRAELISYQPAPPDKARIAVQATKADFDLFAAKNSELVVVLDFSGSMNEPQPGGGKRINKALDALEQCLDKLPTGVQLTILTFSAKQEKELVDVQREHAPWRPEDKNDLMDQLKLLTPNFYTPLVRATAEAAKHFTPGFEGAKTIVVLTDGGDDDFLEKPGEDLRYDKLKKRDLTMTEYLRQKISTDILVNVVGFQIKELLDKNPANLTEGEKQEMKGYNAFRAALNDIGGTFTEVEKADELAAELQRYFLQIRFWIEDKNGNPVEATSKEGLRISTDAGNLRPVPVPAHSPGESYHVLIQAHRSQDKAKRKLIERRVLVQPGEVLVLDLKNTPNGFDLRRDMYARSADLEPVLQPRPAGKDWLMTALGNKSVPNEATRNAREITVSVEGASDLVPDEGGTLRQARPTLAWFEVAREGDVKAVPWLRFYPLPNYPAPVWRLDLADWPGGAPIVNAWWDDGPLPETGGAVLHRGADRDYVRPSQLRGRVVPVQPTEDDKATQVVVESVGWESRTVEVRPGQLAAAQDCLVVRLRYPEGRPYFIQLPENVQPAGYEHRFYTEANKYTGVFFGVEPAKVENLDWLKLVSVEAVHRKAIHADGAPDGDQLWG